MVLVTGLGDARAAAAGGSAIRTEVVGCASRVSGRTSSSSSSAWTWIGLGGMKVLPSLSSIGIEIRAGLDRSTVGCR